MMIRIHCHFFCVVRGQWLKQPRGRMQQLSQSREAFPFFLLFFFLLLLTSARCLDTCLQHAVLTLKVVMGCEGRPRACGGSSWRSSWAAADCWRLMAWLARVGLSGFPCLLRRVWGRGASFDISVRTCTILATSSFPRRRNKKEEYIIFRKWEATFPLF